MRLSMIVAKINLPLVGKLIQHENSVTQASVAKYFSRQIFFYIRVILEASVTEFNEILY